MQHPISLLLALLPVTLCAPAPANTKPIQISKVNFDSAKVTFTFNDPNTKIKTTCSASTIPTNYTTCKNPDVSFKFAPGDKASSFHITLKETSTSQDTYTVSTATSAVTKSPKKFSVPIQNIYPFQSFQLTDLSTFSPSGRPDPGNTPYAFLNFTITDISSNTKPATRCTTQWISNGGEPSKDAIACADPSFVFSVPEFTSIEVLTLALSHTYALGAAGPKVTASGSLGLSNRTPDPNLRCQFGGSGVGSCGIVEWKEPLMVSVSGVTGL